MSMNLNSVRQLYSHLVSFLFHSNTYCPSKWCEVCTHIWSHVWPAVPQGTQASYRPRQLRLCPTHRHKCLPRYLHGKSQCSPVSMALLVQCSDIFLLTSLSSLPPVSLIVPSLKDGDSPSAGVSPHSISLSTSL